MKLNNSIKFILSLEYLLSIVFLLGLGINSIAAQHFSKKQLLSDLAYLKISLEETNINLYEYTSKEEFEDNYHRVRNAIKKDSFTTLEARSIFQSVISKANIGHTNIDYPVESYIKFADEGGQIFPLELAFQDNKALIRKNWSANDSLKPGTEVVSMNGKDIEAILAEIFPLISAERRYFKLAKVELLSFPRYYWQVFGQQDNFEVGIKSCGKLKQIQLKPIKALEDYEAKRSEIIDFATDLKFLNNAAYLDPGSFGQDETAYRKFIDSSFAEIKLRNKENLIIDLRNNPGGDDSLSDYLVSYFADRPFRWASSYKLKTSALLKQHVRKTKDTTTAFWKSALIHENGTIYPYDFGHYKPQPKSKRFTGNVYVLINRHSYSQSTVAAAQIKDYGFGTLVGEETGEYPNLIASIFDYKLPITAITVYTSKGKMIRVSKNITGKGVVPDMIVKDHLVDENDEILEHLLEKLSK